LITYAPTYLGDNTTTWNNSYSLSTYDSSSSAGYLSLVGQGVSSHTSMMSSATASVAFSGTAVYIWGEAYKTGAVVYVDGIAMTYSEGVDGVVGVVEGLNDGWHAVQVLVRGLSAVSIEGMTFTSTSAARYVGEFLLPPKASYARGHRAEGTWAD
jgi:hypothetical protein